MKKLILTFFACTMMLGLFAQQNTIDSFVEGKIDSGVFVEQMVDFFQKYNVTADQQAKIKTLAEKKAENYTIIQGIKAKDQGLYTRKLAGQREHLTSSLRFVLDAEQYTKYMMDIRVELAAQNPQTKKKK
jgi:hypothetical protein